MKILCQQQLIILSILTIGMIGCKSENNNHTAEFQAKDSFPTPQYDTTPRKSIDNKYTQILNSLCLESSNVALQYTNHNTDFYSLNSKDSTQLFIAFSEVDCGYATGSCGRNIEIIERKEREYNSIFKTCGKVDSFWSDTDKRSCILFYTTQTHRKVKVEYKDKQIQSKTISYYNMPIDDLKAISRQFDIPVNDLLRKGHPSINLDATVVDFNTEKNGAYTIKSYQFRISDSNYVYLFLNRGQTQLDSKLINGRSMLLTPNEIVIETPNINIVKYAINKSTNTLILK